MKTISKWIAIMAILCSANITNATDNISATEITKTELLRTTKSWNGEDLPNYPQGKPELVAMKYVIPAGHKLDWHHHVAMKAMWSLKWLIQLITAKIVAQNP